VVVVIVVENGEELEDGLDELGDEELIMHSLANASTAYAAAVHEPRVLLTSWKWL
jgi:hypothetical protein